jgi:hypothetical protein
MYIVSLSVAWQVWYQLLWNIAISRTSCIPILKNTSSKFHFEFIVQSFYIMNKALTFQENEISELK